MKQLVCVVAQVEVTVIVGEKVKDRKQKRKTGCVYVFVRVCVWVYLMCVSTKRKGPTMTDGLCECYSLT
jgi:hypothetical protein